MNARSRHVPLRPVPWDPRAATSAIGEIVADARAHFDAHLFWPAHPLDDVEDGSCSIYVGAAGVIWALEYLRRAGAAPDSIDFRPNLARLLEKSIAEMAGYGDYAVTGSLLLGDMGTALLVMRLAPTPAATELVWARASANTELPIRELMWGMSGSMLACLSMAEMTGEPRWRSLYEVQAARLLSDLEDGAAGPMWEQDLYGRRTKFLGPVHGYAGNMVALLHGWSWLTETQRVRIAEAVPRTLDGHAWRAADGATWPATVGKGPPPELCQHCHGAPGMITTFADVPFASPDLEALLLEGGRYTWSAGPLAKGSNLCHGTGGNGYAFLKLYRRTQDVMWLERARAFAMTAIAQCQEARGELGRGRYALWTGDVGLAIYLWDCLTAVPRFPTVDVF
jgi:hypothetical protein